MKTNQIMKRKLGTFEVQQRTKDGFFNATNLLEQWNKLHSENTRRLNNFWQSSHLQEFMMEIVKDPENGFYQPNSTYLKFSHVESKPPEFGELKKMLSSNSRARADRGGGTWMHPYLFVKFAMYLNPAFEYQVVKFVSDQLIHNRHSAGDGYNQMCRAAARLGATPENYAQIARACNWIIYNKHDHNLRQHSTQEQLRNLDKLQSKIAFMIEMDYVKTMPALITELRKMYHKAHPGFRRQLSLAR